MNDPRIPWLIAGTFAILAVVFVVLLLTGDGDDDVVDASTTTVEASPGTEATTTTAPSPATTVPDPTTTIETTTTSSTTTTTTTPGTWADMPLVVSQHGALGWWDGTMWVQAVEASDLPVSGGEDYRVAKLDTDAVTTGGAPTTVCEPLANPGVELADPELLGSWPDPTGVAISAPWELAPHLVEEVADDGTYAGFAAELLTIRGLDVEDAQVKQLLRVDLEGDGTEEALVVAESIADDGLLAQEGDYSIVFLRKVIEGEVATAILAESIVDDVAEGETPFVLSFGIGAVADLNGDERMEIVVSSAYYEGAGVEVWEYVDDDLGPVLRIGQGCGA